MLLAEPVHPHTDTDLEADSRALCRSILPHGHLLRRSHLSKPSLAADSLRTGGDCHSRFLTEAGGLAVIRDVRFRLLVAPIPRVSTSAVSGADADASQKTVCADIEDITHTRVSSRRPKKVWPRRCLDLSRALTRPYGLFPQASTIRGVW